jgi:hypothetical protein
VGGGGVNPTCAVKMSIQSANIRHSGAYDGECYTSFGRKNEFLNNNDFLSVKDQQTVFAHLLFSTRFTDSLLCNPENILGVSYIRMQQSAGYVSKSQHQSSGRAVCIIDMNVINNNIYSHLCSECDIRLEVRAS